MSVVAHKLALFVVLSACMPPAPPATLGQLQARASFDLGCPYPELRLFHFDDRAKGVSGCGRRLTYVEVCDERRGACTWMLDTPSYEQQLWPGQLSERRAPIPPPSGLPCADRTCAPPTATAPAPAV